MAFMTAGLTLVVRRARRKSCTNETHELYGVGGDKVLASEKWRGCAKAGDLNFRLSATHSLVTSRRRPVGGSERSVGSCCGCTGQAGNGALFRALSRAGTDRASQGRRQ